MRGQDPSEVFDAENAPPYMEDATPSSPEGAPSAAERFIDNCVGMADAVMGLGELDEPEMFQNDLRAARAELSALRRDNAEMRKAILGLIHAIEEDAGYGFAIGEARKALAAAPDRRGA